MQYTYPEPEIVTVPNSLKEQLDRAQKLLAQSDQAEQGGNHSLAVIKAREGMRVLRALAQYAPDNAALMIAGEMGHRGFEFETIERIDTYQVVERKFLGMIVGTDIVNVPKMTRRVHRGRLI